MDDADVIILSSDDETATETKKSSPKKFRKSNDSPLETKTGIFKLNDTEIIACGSRLMGSLHNSSKQTTACDPKPNIETSEALTIVSQEKIVHEETRPKNHEDSSGVQLQRIRLVKLSDLKEVAEVSKPGNTQNGVEKSSTITGTKRKRETLQSNINETISGKLSSVKLADDNSVNSVDAKITQETKNITFVECVSERTVKIPETSIIGDSVKSSPFEISGTSIADTSKEREKKASDATASLEKTVANLDKELNGSATKSDDVTMIDDEEDIHVSSKSLPDVAEANRMNDSEEKKKETLTPLTTTTTTTKDTEENVAEEEKKESAEDSKSKPEIDEPQPGCSISVDQDSGAGTVLDSFDKPQLIVKTKKPCNPVDQDTFPMFLSLCLQTERSSAMEKIVTKLKRNYEAMEPTYAKSNNFINILNEYRDKILKRGKHVYVYISRVLDVMKENKKRVNPKPAKDGRSVEQPPAEVNCEGESSIARKDGEAVESSDDEDFDDPERARVRSKIKWIEKSMRTCEKKIKILEEKEVDFDDEQNSDYMKLERYKEQMIKLYTKLCEYTGEHADAGRSYLRPKLLRVTEITSVDQAINSFINTNLYNNRKKATKGKSFADRVIFPDYHDILTCVAKCNEEQNLGMDKRAQQRLAERAFTQLGTHLQKARKNDYWDTFSLHLEDAEDPAIKDRELSEKLSINREEGEKKLKAVFEEFVKRQGDAKTSMGSDSCASGDENGSDEDDDEEEEEEASDADARNHTDWSEEVISDFSKTPEKSFREVETMEIGSESSCEMETTTATTMTTMTTTATTNDPQADAVAQSSKESEVNVVGDEQRDTEGDKRLSTIDDGTEKKEKEEVENTPQLLRLRSFAKPPVSWKFSQENSDNVESKGERSASPEIIIVSSSPSENSGQKRKIIDIRTDSPRTKNQHRADEGTQNVFGKTIITPNGTNGINGIVVPSNNSSNPAKRNDGTNHMNQRKIVPEDGCGRKVVMLPKNDKIVKPTTTASIPINSVGKEKHNAITLPSPNSTVITQARGESMRNIDRNLVVVPLQSSSNLQSRSITTIDQHNVAIPVLSRFAPQSQQSVIKFNSRESNGTQDKRIGNNLSSCRETKSKERMGVKRDAWRDTSNAGKQSLSVTRETQDCSNFYEKSQSQYRQRSSSAMERGNNRNFQEHNRQTAEFRWNNSSSRKRRSHTPSRLECEPDSRSFKTQTIESRSLGDHERTSQSMPPNRQTQESRVWNSDAHFQSSRLHNQEQRNRASSSSSSLSSSTPSQSRNLDKRTLAFSVPQKVSKSTGKFVDTSRRTESIVTDSRDNRTSSQTHHAQCVRLPSPECVTMLSESSSSVLKPRINENVPATMQQQSPRGSSKRPADKRRWNVNSGSPLNKTNAYRK